MQRREPDPRDRGFVPGEEILLETKPVFFAFFSFYLPGLFLIAVSVLGYIYHDEVLQYAPTRYLPEPYATYALLAAAVLIPAVVYSFLQLNLRWVILGAAALAIAIGGTEYALEQSWAAPLREMVWYDYAPLALLFAVGLVSVLKNEVYRQSHRYQITNARIFTAAGILPRRHRTLPLSKINDIVQDQNFVGALLGFGTLVPLTASGLGMGANMAEASGSASKGLLGLPTLGVRISGGHSIQVPKSRTHEALFGVRRPDRVVHEIMNILAEREIRRH